MPDMQNDLGFNLLHHQRKRILESCRILENCYQSLTGWANGLMPSRADVYGWDPMSLQCNVCLCSRSFFLPSSSNPLGIRDPREPRKMGRAVGWSGIRSKRHRGCLLSKFIWPNPRFSPPPPHTHRVNMMHWASHVGRVFVLRWAAWI